MIYFVYAVAWLSTALATGIGVYFTHSAWCLCAFVLPASISLLSKDDDKNKENKKQSCDTLNSKEGQC